MELLGVGNSFEKTELNNMKPTASRKYGHIVSVLEHPQGAGTQITQLLKWFKLL